MATVTRENIGLLNDKITVKVAKEDYLPSFEKALKTYSKTANIPGFRKGMVPAGMIKKMHGQSVFTDEVLRTVEKQLTDYMQNEKLEIFAQPLPLPENDARQLNFNEPTEYAFAFEVGLKPDFKVADLAKEKTTRYAVTITDEMINEEVDRLRLRHGKMSDPETVTGDDNVLNVTFTEADEEGNVVEGGIKKDNSLLVKYFAENFRNTLHGRKKDDAILVQLNKAFDEKEREWVLGDLGLDKHDAAAAGKFFNMLITKVGLVEKADLNETFFEAAFPGKNIKTEEEFRNTVKEESASYWNKQSSNHLQHELYHVLLDHTKIEFPETFLKRWIQQGGEAPKTAEQAEAEFPTFANQLKWTLIIDQLVRENNIEVKPEDLQAFARNQLFSYMGMPGGGEEQPWVADYINRMMQDRKFVEDAYHRIQTEKVFGWAETQVKATDKPVTVEEFTKELEKHQHHHH
ncbi:trigger factor [Paraflavitalea sp. CAU 1676]|jgi:trigger factor|uniref:trigger factor n=1 Tax=Paraflavitalea sp. CAU 1676 TaxID=3032598 RepID=UPI0023D9A9FD|nr:trigger factor [Paraflavitalea sp. CAU 1676]MDF2187404.1 trigger factor [Paraflavitalea sp. CAU 1676]